MPAIKIYSLLCLTATLGLAACNSAISTNVTPASPSVPTVSVSLTSSPAAVTSGESSTLTWSSNNASACTASNTAANSGWTGAKTVSASPANQTLSNLTSTGSYTLTCTGTGGTASQSVTITVNAPSSLPTVSLAAAPPAVVSGDPSTLTWSSTNATSCTASGAWSGSRATSGRESTGALNVTSTYTLTCSDAGGNTSARSVAIKVSSPGAFVPPYPLPAAGQALALGTQTAQAIRPASHDAGAWQYSLFDSYGGGVLVTSFSKAGAYVLAGSGGHRSPEHTGAVAFDFETGTWKLLTDQSGTPARSDMYFVAETNGSPEYEIAVSPTTPNTVPSPPHPYMNQMPLPTELGGGSLGSVVYAIQSAQCAESVASTRSHRFDLATRTWSRYTSNRLSDVLALSDANDAPSVFDPTAKRIWQLPNQIHSTQKIGYIDLTEVNPQWRVSAAWDWPPTWDNTHSAWLDDTRRLILMQSPTRLVALDLNNLSAGPKLLNFTGTPPPSGNRWAFYPPNGSFYNKGNTGNEVWKLTPPSGDPLTGTWTFTSFTVPGNPLPQITDAAVLYGARHFTRFFYVPSIEVFAWIATADSPVMLIRPPQ